MNNAQINGPITNSKMYEPEITNKQLRFDLVYGSVDETLNKYGYLVEIFERRLLEHV